MIRRLIDVLTGRRRAERAKIEERLAQGAAQQRANARRYTYGVGRAPRHEDDGSGFATGMLLGSALGSMGGAPSVPVETDTFKSEGGSFGGGGASESWGSDSSPSCDSSPSDSGGGSCGGGD